MQTFQGLLVQTLIPGTQNSTMDGPFIRMGSIWGSGNKWSLGPGLTSVHWVHLPSGHFSAPWMSNWSGHI